MQTKVKKQATNKVAANKSKRAQTNNVVKKVNDLLSEKKKVSQANFNSYYEYYTYCIKNRVKLETSFCDDFHCTNYNNK